VEIYQTRSFAKAVKKLHSNQRNDLQNAIRLISAHPELGQQKRGDLADMRVFKFSMINQLTLLAYQWDGGARLILQDLGSHENFYRDLKQK
jgi:mRNA-degrading endonuclease YafQ of YafQ-DinJ toxin-antitoxin module